MTSTIVLSAKGCYERLVAIVETQWSMLEANMAGQIVVQIINPRNEKLMVDTYLETCGDAADADLFICTRDVPDFRKYVEDFSVFLESRGGGGTSGGKLTEDWANNRCRSSIKTSKYAIFLVLLQVGHLSST